MLMFFPAAVRRDPPVWARFLGVAVEAGRIPAPRRRGILLLAPTAVGLLQDALWPVTGRSLISMAGPVKIPTLSTELIKTNELFGIPRPARRYL